MNRFLICCFCQKPLAENEGMPHRVKGESGLACNVCDTKYYVENED